MTDITEWVPLKCSACGDTHIADIRYFSEEKEIKIFGLILSKHRPATLITHCFSCGKATSYEPGTIRFKPNQTYNVI